MVDKAAQLRDTKQTQMERTPNFLIRAAAIVCCAIGVATVAGAGYVEPVVIDPMFAGEGVELLDVDREKLAKNIAAFVVNNI